nr:hypothetical protein CFP56_09521 [Quercus suber]
MEVAHELHGNIDARSCPIREDHGQITYLSHNDDIDPESKRYSCPTGLGLHGNPAHNLLDMVWFNGSSFASHALGSAQLVPYSSSMYIVRATGDSPARKVHIAHSTLSGMTESRVLTSRSSLDQVWLRLVISHGATFTR